MKKYLNWIVIALLCIMVSVGGVFFINTLTNIQEPPSCLYRFALLYGSDYLEQGQVWDQCIVSDTRVRYGNRNDWFLMFNSRFGLDPTSTAVVEYTEQNYQGKWIAHIILTSSIQDIPITRVMAYADKDGRITYIVR
jgi:hypothetical protein